MYVSKQYLDEMSFFVGTTARQILDNTPTVTKKEFFENMQTGDIILAFSPKQAVEQKKVRFIAKMYSTLQGTPYSTSKLVVDKNTIVGYGTRVRKATEPDIVKTYSTRSLLNDRQELCLVRVTDATDAQKDKAVKFALSKIGLGYNNLDLFKTLWHAITRGKLSPFFKNETLDPDEIKEMQRPLFCSSLIALGYVSAGYQHRFNNRNPYMLWPKDFLLDGRTEKVCKVDMGYNF